MKKIMASILRTPFFIAILLTDSFFSEARAHEYEHPLVVVNHISRVLTGKFAPKELRRRWENAPSDKETIRAAISESFEYLTWDSEKNIPREDFTNWLISYHTDLFKIEIPRNNGNNDGNWWRMPESDPLVTILNREYLDRYPERYNRGPTWGGSGQDIPVSTYDLPNDFLYYLFELEPAILAASIAANDRNYTDITTTQFTVRSPALNIVAGQVLSASEFSLPELSGETGLTHWTGEWKFVPRLNSYYGLHAGVLTTQAYMKSYPRERNWANIGIYSNLLCHDIKQTIRPPTGEFRFYKTIDADPLSKEQCAGCHYIIDGIANIRMEYLHWAPSRYAEQNTYHYPRFDVTTSYGLSAFNKFHSTSFTKFPVESQYYNVGSGKFISVKTMRDLGLQVANDPAFATCAVNNAFKSLYGRSATVDDRIITESALLRFRSSGYRFKELLLALLDNEAFYEKR